jgi:hypothetical protein
MLERRTAEGSSGTFIGNDFTVTGGGKALAWSLGIVQYGYGDNPSPFVLIFEGHMPIDDFYGKDDPTGILSICKYLK